MEMIYSETAYLIAIQSDCGYEYIKFYKIW